MLSLTPRKPKKKAFYGKFFFDLKRFNFFFIGIREGPKRFWKRKLDLQENSKSRIIKNFFFLLNSFAAMKILSRRNLPKIPLSFKNSLRGGGLFIFCWTKKKDTHYFSSCRRSKMVETENLETLLIGKNIQSNFFSKLKLVNTLQDPLCQERISKVFLRVQLLFLSVFFRMSNIECTS